MNRIAKLFRRMRKRNGDTDGKELQTAGEALLKEDTPDSAQLQQMVVELCGQMAGVSRELAQVRQEYQIVTNYLNDVQTLEDMPEEQKAPILECAARVAALDKERSEFLQTERRLSESQFVQMQEMEDEMPDIIGRLRTNEADLDVIKKDLSRLEGEKLQWSMQKTDSEHRQTLLRKMSVYLLVIFATVAVLFGLLAFALKQNTQIPMMLSTGLAAVLGVYIFVRYQDAGADIRRAQANRNRAVTLENHVKIRYVNAKNAVDYTCENYHVRDSRDLTYLYEQYQEEVRELEKLRRTSSDLEFYNSQLVRLLRKRNFYDAQVWMNHANAIIDSREMVELKHDLITRRQKLRARIEYNMNTIADMKKEALRHVSAMGVQGENRERIVKKIEEIGS